VYKLRGKWPRQLSKHSLAALEKPGTTLAEVAAYAHALVDSFGSLEPTWMGALVNRTAPLLSAQQQAAAASGSKAAAPAASGATSTQQAPAGYDAAALASLCVSVAKLQQKPAERWNEKLAAAVEALPSAYTPAQLVDALWGLHLLRVQPSEQTLNSLVIKMMGRSAGLPAVTLVRAATLAGAASTPNIKWWEELQGKITALISSHQAALGRRDLRALLMAAASIVTPHKPGAKPGMVSAGFGNALVRAVVQQDQDMKPSEAVQVVEAIAVLGLGTAVPASLLEAYEKGVLSSASGAAGAPDAAASQGSSMSGGEGAEGKAGSQDAAEKGKARKASDKGSAQGKPKSEYQLWQDVMTAEKTAAVAGLMLASEHMPSQAWVQHMREVVLTPDIQKLSDAAAARTLWMLHLSKAPAPSPDWLSAAVSKASSPGFCKGASAQQLLDTITAAREYGLQLTSSSEVAKEVLRKLPGAVKGAKASFLVSAFQGLQIVDQKVPEPVARDMMHQLVHHAPNMTFSDLSRCINPAFGLCGPQYLSNDLIALLDEKLSSIQEPEIGSVSIFFYTVWHSGYTLEGQQALGYLSKVQGQLVQVPPQDLVALLAGALRSKVQPSDAWLEACATALDAREGELDGKAVVGLLQMIMQIKTDKEHPRERLPAGCEQMVLTGVRVLKRVYAEDAGGVPTLPAGYFMAALWALFNLDFKTGPLIQDTLARIAAAVQAAAQSSPADQTNMLDRMQQLAETMVALYDYAKAQEAQEDEALLDAAALNIADAVDKYLQARLQVLQPSHIVRCCFFMSVAGYAPSQQLQRSLCGRMEGLVGKLDSHEAFEMIEFCSLLARKNEGVLPETARKLAQQLLLRMTAVEAYTETRGGETIQGAAFALLDLSDADLIAVLKFAADIEFQPPPSSASTWNHMLVSAVEQSVLFMAHPQNEDPSNGLAVMRLVRQLLVDPEPWHFDTMFASAALAVTGNKAIEKEYDIIRDHLFREQMAAQQQAASARKGGKAKRAGAADKASSTPDAAGAPLDAAAAAAGPEVDAASAVVEVEVEVEGGAAAGKAVGPGPVRPAEGAGLMMEPAWVAAVLHELGGLARKPKAELMLSICQSSLRSLEATATQLSQPEYAEQLSVQELEGLWDTTSISYLLHACADSGYNPGPHFLGACAAAASPQLRPGFVSVPAVAAMLTAFAHFGYEPGQAWLDQVTDASTQSLAYFSSSLNEALTQEGPALMEDPDIQHVMKEQATGLQALLAGYAHFKTAPSQTWMVCYYQALVLHLASFSDRALIGIVRSLIALAPHLVSVRKGPVQAPGDGSDTNATASGLPSGQVLDAIMMSLAMRAGRAAGAGVQPEDIANLKLAQRQVQALIDSTGAKAGSAQPSA